MALRACLRAAVPTLAAVLALVSFARAQTPQGTAFTYQGRLKEDGTPASGTYDFQFLLYEAVTGGSQVGPVVTRDDVLVDQGFFTVTLNSIKTVDDPANAVGLHTSMTNGADGLPVISYFDDTADALKVLKCGNLACTAGNMMWTVDDTASDVGRFSSIALGSDGFPVISYYDATAFALKVAKCNNATCTISTRTTVDDPPANSVGFHTSIAIGAGGLPIVSYHDFTAGALKVARCGNPACSAGNVLTTVDDSPDPSTSSGQSTSLAIGSDGLPVMSYSEFFNSAYRLKVARCDNLACNGSNTITVADPQDSLDTSVAIGSDGFPVISYFTGNGCALRVAKCGDAACSTGTMLSTVDGPASQCAESIGVYSSIVIGSDGLPVISYLYHQFVPENSALRVAKCSTGSCR